MKPIASIAATAATAFALLAAPAVAKKSGEEKLAELLEGREAGEPTSCINTLPSDNLRILDKTALVYGRGNTIYVNRTKHPEQLDDNDILVIRRYSSRLCRLDNVTTRDRSSMMFSGAIFLDEFVPYKRVKDKDSDDS